MLEREMYIPSVEEEIVKEEKEEEEDSLLELPSSEIVKPEEETFDKIDKNDKNYHIHKGIIDCLNTNECMEITLPIQLEYNNIISNVTYIEVVSNSHKVMGYFIKYIFKPYQFKTYDMCKNVMEEIKLVLNNKIDNISCSENGELQIKTTYEEGEYNEEN